MVGFERTPTLLELVKLEEELSDLLGVNVDLLTEEQISPYIKPFLKVIEI